MSPTPAFTLSRNPFGRLLFTPVEGEPVEAVPVRAFPIGAPDEGIALVDAHGHELLWIDTLEELAPEPRALVEAELAAREFMPVIHRLIGVGSFATPSTWQVETSRGPTSFVLKGEEDIRRLTGPALLIADSHGIHYLIRDRFALDAHSRKLLDRFL